MNQAYRYFDKNRVGYLKVGAPTGTYFWSEIFYALHALVDLIYTMFLCVCFNKYKHIFMSGVILTRLLVRDVAIDWYLSAGINLTSFVMSCRRMICDGCCTALENIYPTGMWRYLSAKFPDTNVEIFWSACSHTLFRQICLNFPWVHWSSARPLESESFKVM